MNQITNLGVIVSELKDVAEAEDYAHAEIAMMKAPLECHKMVANSAKGCAKAVLIAAGVTATQVLEELKRRCSEKWVFDSGLLQMLESN